MDLRHICHLVAEALKLGAGTLLGADAGGADAQVALVGEDSGTVLLTVECREYQLVICERKRRAGQAGEIEYRKVRLPWPFRHGAIEIHGLEFALGRQGPGATVVHVRGECGGGVSFAGCIAISEGRDVPDPSPAMGTTNERDGRASGLWSPALTRPGPTVPAWGCSG